MQVCWFQGRRKEETASSQRPRGAEAKTSEKGAPPLFSDDQTTTILIGKKQWTGNVSLRLIRSVPSWSTENGLLEGDAWLMLMVLIVTEERHHSPHGWIVWNAKQKSDCTRSSLCTTPLMRIRCDTSIIKSILFKLLPLDSVSSHLPHPACNLWLPLYSVIEINRWLRCSSSCGFCRCRPRVSWLLGWFAVSLFSTSSVRVHDILK